MAQYMVVGPCQRSWLSWTKTFQIRDVIPGIRIYSCPFARLGVVPIGGRSTAVRLSDGKSVLVVASTPLTDGTRKSVDELGDVKYIIGPDAEHYLYIKEWKAAYPSARVCGVQRTAEASGVPVEGVWGRDQNPLGDDPVVNADFRSEFVSGHANKEVALLHVPSKTLIQADLLFNLPAKEQYSMPGAGKPSGGLLSYVFDPAKMNPYNSTYQGMVLQLARDKQFVFSLLPFDPALISCSRQVAHSVQVIDSWDFDRIIPCHGEVIETKGKDAWRACFTKLFEGVAAGKYKKYTPSSATTVSLEQKSSSAPIDSPSVAPVPEAQRAEL
jgi:hypothetical protein